MPGSVSVNALPGRTRVRAPCTIADNPRNPSTAIAGRPSRLPLTNRVTTAYAPNAASGYPMRMNRTAAHAGVGGVYRVPHALHTRSKVKATNSSDCHFLYSPPPQSGQTLLIGYLLIGDIPLSNDQAQRPQPETPDRLQQSRTHYLNRPAAQWDGGWPQRSGQAAYQNL